MTTYTFYIIFFSLILIILLGFLIGYSLYRKKLLKQLNNDKKVKDEIKKEVLRKAYQQSADKFKWTEAIDKLRQETEHSVSEKENVEDRIREELERGFITKQGEELEIIKHREALDRLSQIIISEILNPHKSLHTINDLTIVTSLSALSTAINNMSNKGKRFREYEDMILSIYKELEIQGSIRKTKEE